MEPNSLLTVSVLPHALFFAVILASLAAEPFLSKILKLPGLVTLILIGIVLSLPLPDGSQILYRAQDPRLLFLEQIGLLYIMFLAGLQTNFQTLVAHLKSGILFGLVTFLIPFVLGLGVGWTQGFDRVGLLLMGLIFSPHTLMAYPVVARQGLTNHKTVAIVVGGTSVTTVLTLVGFALAKSLGEEGSLWVVLGNVLVILPLFIGLLFKGIPMIWHRISKRSDLGSPFYLTFVWLVLFGCASITEQLGVSAIVGAFAAGLVLNRLIQTQDNLLQQVAFVGNTLFIPIFALSIGILFDVQLFLGSFASWRSIGLSILLISAAIVGKLLASGSTELLFQGNLTTFFLSFGLTVSRSALVLVIALEAVDLGAFTPEVLNIVVAYIALSCILGPSLVSAVIPQLVKQVDQAF